MLCFYVIVSAQLIERIEAGEKERWQAVAGVNWLVL